MILQRQELFFRKKSDNTDHLNTVSRYELVLAFLAKRVLLVDNSVLSQLRDIKTLL